MKATMVVDNLTLTLKVFLGFDEAKYNLGKVNPFTPKGFPIDE